MNNPLRPELDIYIVGWQYITEMKWIDARPGSIAAAQNEYDAGYAEMVQARNKEKLTTFLYCIPRNVRISRRKYFSKIDDENHYKSGKYHRGQKGETRGNR